MLPTTQELKEAAIAFVVMCAALYVLGKVSSSVKTQALSIGGLDTLNGPSAINLAPTTVTGTLPSGSASISSGPVVITGALTT